MFATSLRVRLNEADMEEVGRELDAMRDEVMDSRGERDRRYILKLIQFHRMLALSARLVILASIAFHPTWGHAFSGWFTFLEVRVQ